MLRNQALQQNIDFSVEWLEASLECSIATYKTKAEILNFISDAHTRFPDVAEYLVHSLKILIETNLNTQKNRDALFSLLDTETMIAKSVAFILQTISNKNFELFNENNRQNNFNQFIAKMNKHKTRDEACTLMFEMFELNNSLYEEQVTSERTQKSGEYQRVFNRICPFVPMSVLVSGLHARTGARSLFATAARRDPLFDKNVLKLVNTLATGKSYNKK